MKDEKFLSSRQKDVIERARAHPNNNSFSNIMARQGIVGTTPAEEFRNSEIIDREKFGSKR